MSTNHAFIFKQCNTLASFLVGLATNMRRKSGLVNHGKVFRVLVHAIVAYQIATSLIAGLELCELSKFEYLQACISLIILCSPTCAVCPALLYLQVHYNDQVKFESIKTEGQFLHCSSKMFGDVGFHVLRNKSVILSVACLL